MENEEVAIRKTGLTPERPQPIQELSPEELRRQRLTIAIIIVVVFLFLMGTLVSVYYLSLPTTDTERIRDIFIIFLSLEFLVLGLAMMILIVQLATLINLLQNEIKPIIESTNETANTLRGTATFLSENLTEPVITLNEYLSAFRQLLITIGLFRR
jgi:amino acid permease